MKEVLHVLIEHDEGSHFQKGGPFQLDTHGIQHVVLQFERPKRTYNKSSGTAVIDGKDQKLLAHTPPKRGGWSPERRAKFMATMKRKAKERKHQ